MNDLSNATLRDPHSPSGCKPIPKFAICILIPLFLTGLGVSVFILIAVHNAFFFVSFLLLSVFVLAFLLWNSLSWWHRNTLLIYLRSLPDSNLRNATEGELVKITGPVSCGNLSLESSYEKVDRCIYTSTLLYEYEGFRLRASIANHFCLFWKLAYSERFCTDFYISDRKSGIRVFVKAGRGCKVIPLVTECRLVETASTKRLLSPDLRKWLRDRNLSVEARLMHLEEGYIREGNCVTVLGMLHRDDGITMVVQPIELVSTGCLWQRLLLPVDFDGLILGMTNINSMVGLHS